MTAVDAWRDRLVSLCEIVWIAAEIHAPGEARCRQARERRLSLTDCVSIEVERRLARLGDPRRPVLGRAGEP